LAPPTLNPDVHVHWCGATASTGIPVRMDLDQGVGELLVVEVGELEAALRPRRHSYQRVDVCPIRIDALCPNHRDDLVDDLLPLAFDSFWGIEG
jgi:hypothetical protein